MRSAILILCVTLIASEALQFSYETKTFDVLLDHFSFVQNKTFPLRYLINNNYTANDESPILFYTGNEGDIKLFAENTGFMWKVAAQLSAGLVFAEHRYYGESQPFGNNSFKDADHRGYLSSEQALADYAQLLSFLNPNAKRPVIAFGGSYGGMLAAWFRIKYPHLVVGALASSAPVLQFPDVVPCDIFNRILTSVYGSALDEADNFCVENIKKLWPVLQNFTQTDEGRKILNQKFNFCTPMNKTDDFKTFYDFLQDVLGNLAMANYPYPASFLADLPAYPVRQFCGQMNKNYAKSEDLLTGFNQALQVYTNYKGTKKCLDITSAYDSSLDSKGWEFQTCTDMVMPMCSNGTTDMFLPKKWDFKEFSDDCYTKYQVRPQPNAAMTKYGSRFLYASNIIFSNGLLDPWSGGGVLRVFNDNISVMIIPEGAHHIDLRADDPADPRSVTDARKQYVKKFNQWINAFVSLRREKDAFAEKFGTL